MKLMQSKAGMFLRILGSLVIMAGVVIVFKHDYFYKPFYRSAEWERGFWFDTDQHKTFKQEANKLIKEQEALYLESVPNDVQAKEKIQHINQQLDAIRNENEKQANAFKQEEDERIKKLDAQYEQEAEGYARQFSLIYLAIFIICLLGALFIPIEWISFGFLGALLAFIHLGYFDRMLSWWGLPSIGFYVGIGLAGLFSWLLWKRKHWCNVCEIAGHKKSGFRGTKLYSFLWYLLGFIITWAVLLVSFLLLKPVNRSAFKVSDEFSSLSLSGQYGNLNAEKKSIINSGHITNEGKQKILELNREMEELDQRIDELHS